MSLSCDTTRYKQMSIFDFLRNKKPDAFDEKAILYHYTSIDTFDKFLGDCGDLYCTHFQVLNDSAEMTMGMMLAEKYLRKELKWPEIKGAWFRENYNMLVKGCEIVTPWVMSFSSERDSLNQWSMYTNRTNGGVAVGFDVGQLWSAIDRWPGCYSKAALTSNGEKGEKPLFDLRLLPCLYSETDEKLIWELFDLRLKPYIAVFERIGVSTTVQDIEVKDFTLAINAILEVSSIIKHEAFRNEKEVRLVLLPMTKSLADCELVGGKPRWKTYVCMTRREGYGNPRRQALRGMIKEVVVSPHGDKSAIWTTVRCLLDKYEMNWCTLEKSVLPYNGR